MKKYTQFPPLLLARALSLYFKGCVHFPKDKKGLIIKEKKEDYIIFRQVMVTCEEKQNDPGVELKIFFRFKNFSLNINRVLSLIPIPFIIAQPGFRSKTWMFGLQTGTFHGLYEWQNIENAQNYRESLPLKLMKKRALPDTLIYDIIDKQQVAKDY